jgi:histone H3/H4
MARVKRTPKRSRRTSCRSFSANHTAAGSYPAAKIFKTAAQVRQNEIATYNREKAAWGGRNAGKYPFDAPKPLPARAGMPNHVTRADLEIAHYTQGTGLLLPRLTFARLVREVMMDAGSSRQELRIQAAALLALQEGTEAYLVSFFEASGKVATHAKRKTVMQVDMQLVKWFQGSNVVKVNTGTII